MKIKGALCSFEIVIRREKSSLTDLNCLEIKQKKKRMNSDFSAPHTECSAVAVFSHSTCDLSVAASLAVERPQGQFIGRHKAGKTQLAGRRPPTLNKPSFLHRHTQPRTCVASASSLFISARLRICPHLQR